MEAIAIEDGHNLDPLQLMKREIEPDSSERDAESPDEGNGHSIEIKEEPLEEDGASLSPAASDGDRQSGSGGEDGLIQKTNRRKRKVPMKLPTLPSSFDSEDGDVNDLQPLCNPAKRQTSSLALQALVASNSALNQQPKQCSVMTEERARNQAINSMPRSTCPVCGDKANGLHYGIYTCEACKNFFKRSVAFDAAKSYVCKYNRSCNVNITEVDGVKMKGPRCQACRYQACLDAGMYHSGVQRTRGGRHGYSPIKQRSGSVDKYPTIATPNISAAMAAVEQQQSQNFDPADVVSISMSPSDLSEQDETASASTASNLHQQHSFLQKNQIWEQFVSDNVRNEVDLLKSRTSIAETLLAEKTKQLDVVQKQVELLKQHLKAADQLNKEQAITIESLKRRLLNGNGSNGNSHRHNGNTNGNGQESKKAVVFENGGVTITPVVTSSTTSVISSKSQNLLSHLLLRGGENKDMATIEPVRSHDGKT